MCNGFVGVRIDGPADFAMLGVVAESFRSLLSVISDAFLFNRFSVRVKDGEIDFLTGSSSSDDASKSQNDLLVSSIEFVVTEAVEVFVTVFAFFRLYVITPEGGLLRDDMSSYRLLRLGACESLSLRVLN